VLRLREKGLSRVASFGNIFPASGGVYLGVRPKKDRGQSGHDHGSIGVIRANNLSRLLERIRHQF